MNEIRIYTLACPITNEIRYIGKTMSPLWKRLSVHWCVRKEENSYKVNWVKSLKKKGTKPIIELLDTCNEEEWEDIEKYWIAQFKFWGFKLVNGTEGGGGTIGSKRTEIQKESRKSLNFKHSEETKKKMSEAAKGRKFSDVHKEKLSAARKGREVKQETREKISKSHTGRPKSKEHAAKVGAKRRIPVKRVLPDGAIEVYVSSTSAMEILGISRETILRSIRNKSASLDGSSWFLGSDPECRSHLKNIKAIAKTGEEFIYNSFEEASFETGVKIPSIKRCLRGGRPTAGGFIWKLSENNS